MTTLTDLIADVRLKVLEVGYAGSGKTGCLAALANAGYKLRIIDLDGNTAPLRTYVKPEARENVEIVTLQDPLQMDQPGGTRGPPKVFAKVMRLLDHWTYKQPDGEVIDLGKPSEWGRDTVLVLDNGTRLGDAALRRHLFLNERRRAEWPDWNAAMSDLSDAIELAASELIGCHVVVIFHLKLVGPKTELPKDSAVVKEAKAAVQEIVPFRLYASALGQTLPPKIGNFFDYILLFETEGQGDRVKRVIRTLPRPEVDVKVPLVNIPAKLPIESGLLTIFEAATGGMKK